MIRIKLNRKRLYPADSVKYLGVKTDSNLNWKSHVNGIATKLKIFLNQSIMHYLNDTLTIYSCIIWGQNISKNALRIINFKGWLSRL